MMIILLYFLKVIYPIAAVMVRIHSPAVVMTAPRSMVLVVLDSLCSWKMLERKSMVESYVSKVVE
jgi:hypothetical protein